MTKKYFVTSDIHGYFDIFYKELKQQGFDEDDNNHYLIICGDAFDRGNQAYELYMFMKELKNKNRLIYIRGNHEDLLFECIEELFEFNGAAHSYHYSNGTIDTIKQFKEKGILTEALDFIKDNTIDFYELENYIFVHGWIPLIVKDNLPKDHSLDRDVEYNKEWKEATKEEWEQARWFNGMEIANRGFIEPHKTIVCGHWHTGYGHYNIHKDCENEFSKSEIYKDKGIIALDACTAISSKVNILCILTEKET